jgi:hypothetical protein
MRKFYEHPDAALTLLLDQLGLRGSVSMVEWIETDTCGAGKNQKMVGFEWTKNLTENQVLSRSQPVRTLTSALEMQLRAEAEQVIRQMAAPPPPTPCES